VLTQGRGDKPEWVKSYTLSYRSNEDVNFNPYRQKGVVKVVEQILCGIICPSHSDIFTKIRDFTAVTLFIYSVVKITYFLYSYSRIYMFETKRISYREKLLHDFCN
jgi:hypothetical protein